MATVTTTDERRAVRRLDLTSREDFLAFLREHNVTRRRRLLVTGSRDWTDRDVVRRVLHELTGEWTLLEGEAQGLDSIARDYALDRGWTVAGFPALWEPTAFTPPEKIRTSRSGRKYRADAGPLRNEVMLACRPKRVIAFSADLGRSKGTRHCATLAWRLGLPVTIVDAAGATVTHQLDAPQRAFESLTHELR